MLASGIILPPVRIKPSLLLKPTIHSTDLINNASYDFAQWKNPCAMVSKAILTPHNKFIRKLNLYKCTSFYKWLILIQCYREQHSDTKKKVISNPTFLPNYAYISVESRTILNSDNFFSEMPVINRIGTRFVRVLIYSFIHSLPQKTQENVALPACCHIMSGNDLITRKTPGSVVHSLGRHLPSLAVLNQC